MVEDPSLDDLWDTIRSAGLEVVGLPVDEHGSVLDALDVDALLVTPAHQFPTGAVLAPERRRALLGWGGIVIEDDYDSEYRYDRAPVETLQRLAPDRVVYLGAASKMLAPALRLGWLRRPPELARRSRVSAGGRFGRRRVTARAYAGLLATGEVDRHLRRTRREYRERRDRLVAASKARRRGRRRRRRAAPAPAAATRDGRGRRRRSGWPSSGSGSAASPATACRRIRPRSCSATGGCRWRRSTRPSIS